MIEGMKLRYPQKSHRKDVLIPVPSIKLAEFFGIMLGNGGINNPWQANVTVNAVADRQYANHVADLMRELFGVVPALRPRKDRKALVISLASTSAVDFLVGQGLPRGNKLKAGLRIPDWILGKRMFRIACMRGLMDTDGGLYIHEHLIGGKKYRNIGLCFTSYSEPLLAQVAHIFEEFRFMPHIGSRGRSIYLYQAEEIARYLKVFGTSNKRISSCYAKWRRG